MNNTVGIDFIRKTKTHYMYKVSFTIFYFINISKVILFLLLNYRTWIILLNVDDRKIILK